MGKIIASFTLFALGLVPLCSAAPEEQTTITPVSVTDKIFMLRGKGGNIGLFIGEDGTFLIDDQYAPLTDKIVSAIKEAGGELPRFLVNTHYHSDHTGGNENFGRRGALIFSHDNVRERLLTGSYLAAFDNRTPPLSKPALPVVTFADQVSFHLNGDTLIATHIPHAHTDGDSFIRFKKANVIHAGDIFFNGFFPFIDVAHGGTLRGTIDGVDRILALADEKTRIIPGHGPPAGQQELIAYRAMLTTAYERLLGFKTQGKTLQQAVAARPLADLDKEWGDGMFSSDRWIEIIYPGVY